MADSGDEHRAKHHRAEHDAAAAAPDDTVGASIIIRGLRHDPAVPEDVVRAAAESFGPVVGVVVFERGHLRGRAIVDFATPAAAVAAVSATVAGGASDLLHLPAQDGEAVSAEVKATKAQSDQPAAPAPLAADGQPLNRRQRRALARQATDSKQPAAVDGAPEKPAGASPSAKPVAALDAAPLGTAVQLVRPPSQHREGASPQQQRQPHRTSGAETDTPRTLYVCCKHMRAIFDVFAFFKEHKVEGHARDVVFVTASRKPYFLVDCRGDRAQHLYDGGIALDGKTYKEERVTVRDSTQTVQEYRAKKPDVVGRTAKPRSAGPGSAKHSDDDEPSVPPAAAAVAPTMMVPRGVRGRGGR